MIGKTASAVSKYERGQINEVKVLAALAGVLRKPADWLLFGDSPQPRGHVPEDWARSASLGELVRLLQAGGTSDRVLRLPLRYRQRYRERIMELKARVQRELEEYGRLLETEYRAERGKRRGGQ